MYDVCIKYLLLISVGIFSCVMYSVLCIDNVFFSYVFYIVNNMDVTNENLIKLQVILNGFPLFWSKLGQCT